MYDIPAHLYIPAGAEHVDTGSTLDLECDNDIEDTPLEGIAPEAPEWRMEGPENYFTPPTSPTKDEEITALFDALCEKEIKDVEYSKEVQEGAIWTQAQFTEAELLWEYALDDVPSPSVSEELALLSMEDCLDI